jgi:hypothetical protein
MYRFSVNRHAPNIALVGPADSDVVRFDRVKFSWRPSDQTADRYQIILARTPDYMSGLFGDSTITDSSWKSMMPCDSCRLWWKIRAHSVVGWGTFSASGNFVVQLERARLLLPLNEDSIRADTTRLVWAKAAPPASHYWVQVCDDSIFQDLKLNNQALEDTQAVFTPLVKGVTYWWRVRVGDTLGWGSLAPVRKFERPRDTSGGTGTVGDDAMPVGAGIAFASPNPFADATTLHVVIARPGSFDVRVIDLLGRTVLEHHARNADALSVRVDASLLPAGAYRCVIRAGGRIYQTTLVHLK